MSAGHRNPRCDVAVRARRRWHPLTVIGAADRPSAVRYGDRGRRRPARGQAPGRPQRGAPAGGRRRRPPRRGVSDDRVARRHLGHSMAKPLGAAKSRPNDTTAASPTRFPPDRDSVSRPRSTESCRAGGSRTAAGDEDSQASMSVAASSTSTGRGETARCVLSRGKASSTVHASATAACPESAATSRPSGCRVLRGLRVRRVQQDVGVDEQHRSATARSGAPAPHPPSRRRDAAPRSRPQAARRGRRRGSPRLARRLRADPRMASLTASFTLNPACPCSRGPPRGNALRRRLGARLRRSRGRGPDQRLARLQAAHTHLEQRIDRAVQSGTRPLRAGQGALAQVLNELLISGHPPGL